VGPSLLLFPLLAPRKMKFFSFLDHENAFW
jgi:hypothetical protein